MDYNELNVQAINNFDTAKGKYLQVVKTDGQEHLALTSPCKWWLGRLIRKILMCMGWHSASLRKVASYLKQHENQLLSLPLDAKQKQALKDKLIKYEKNHKIHFTFLSTLFGERADHDVDHQTKMKNLVTSHLLPKSILVPKDAESDQKSIGEVLQKNILPIYKTPAPQCATRKNGDGGTRIVVSTEPQDKYESHCKKVEQKHVTARNPHGTMHATRVAFWTQVLLQIYQKDRNVSCNPILLALGGGCHDTARENEGTDYWDEESGLLFDHFLEKMEIGKDERRPYVHALIEKDPHPGKFSSDIQRIVHDADCLDIIRCKVNFNPSYLCFYHFPQANGFDKDKFVQEAKDFIKMTDNDQLKVMMEHESQDFYGDLIRLLFKVQSEQPHRFPLITTLAQSSMACYQKDMDTEFVAKLAALCKK